MKNSKNILLVFLLVILSVQLQAEGDEKNKQNKIYKTNGQPEYAEFNINNISTWIKNNGDTDNIPTGFSGFIYPKGSSKGVFFSSGLLYGGIIDGEIRVGGSRYLQGQVPGRILENGLAEETNLPHVRIYRVRRDYKTADLNSEVTVEAADTNGNFIIYNILNATKEEAFEQYKKDWYEWPANDGAPFEDINHDGIYNPDIDTPGYPGADQTIWYVCNDLNEEAVSELFGSKPIGIEMQTTVWGYNTPGVLMNVVFKKYTLINKSGRTINDMYVGMWSDPDLGDATDDFVGCDTLLSLAYVYNGDNYDATYGDIIPAGGFKLLQGPKVNNTNLGMTSFNVFRKSTPNYGDGNSGSYPYGTLYYYNYFQGKVADGSHLFQTPPQLGSYFTKYMVSGNPSTKQGWIDGIVYPPGDRRMMLSSGPFEMAQGDTQEILFAQMAGGGFDNIGRLNSISLLKYYSIYLEKINRGSQFISSPTVKHNSFDKELLLSWGNETAHIIEDYNDGEDKFQGYNVYQLPKENSNKDEYIRIATFDIVDGIGKILELSFNPNSDEEEYIVSQFGNDTGIQRFLKIDNDYITGHPLNNGTPYYYKISAYTYNDRLKNFFSTNENFSQTIKVIPQSPNPGIRYESETGDSITVSHLRGTAEADVNIIVVDPTEVKGHQYEISFKKNNENKIVWDLDDVTENITVLSNQKNITGTDEYIIVDGIKIVITQNENTPILENDLYRFTTPKVIYNEELAKTDVENINVFPNPYYGYNPMETQKLGNFVMINHLPKRATIRIFNLAGQLVRTLHKDSENQFYLWDLQNEHQFLVGSGLYILHIEMPDLGKVKVLKLAVVLGTEVPDFY